MIAGNILALAQTNIKRMLAYSSVAHAGYMFLGILAFRPGASGGILFYLAGYAPILVGCFNIVALFPGEKGGHELRDYIGMGHRSPFIAGIFTLMLLTLAGLPPTPVFWGKLLMFMAAVDPGGSNLVNLVILAMLTSLIGVYYYLRVVVYMYMREPEGDSQPVQPGLDALGMTGQLGFWLLTFVILILGLSPGHLIYVLDRAVNHLRLPG
jgi:NADH-quinone oxidoreductase subunit N